MPETFLPHAEFEIPIALWLYKFDKGGDCVTASVSRLINFMIYFVLRMHFNKQMLKYRRNRSRNGIKSNL